MLTEPTLDRLRALRLGAMADAYRTQLQDPAIGALSFDERVGLLVDAEHLSRDNRKLARRLKEAKLRVAQACLEDLDYAPPSRESLRMATERGRACVEGVARDHDRDTVVVMGHGTLFSLLTASLKGVPPTATYKASVGFGHAAILRAGSVLRLVRDFAPYGAWE